MASSYVQKVIRSVKKSNPHQPEFIQALEEVLHSLEPLFLKDPKYQQNGILERIVEPERQIMFRVRTANTSTASWATSRISTSTTSRRSVRSGPSRRRRYSGIKPAKDVSKSPFLSERAFFRQSGQRGGAARSPSGIRDKS